jgi:hypothetical protein
MRKLIVLLLVSFMSIGGMVFAGDLYNNALAVKVVAPYDHGTGDAAVVGTVVDGLGYGSVTYIISTGSLADVDATFTVYLEDCDEVACDTTNAGVADGFLLGTEALASFTFADDNTVKMLGYTGPKRFTRMTITPANNTGVVLLGVTAIKAHPQYAPVTH